MFIKNWMKEWIKYYKIICFMHNNLDFLTWPVLEAKRKSCSYHGISKSILYLYETEEIVVITQILTSNFKLWEIKWWQKFEKINYIRIACLRKSNKDIFFKSEFNNDKSSQIIWMNSVIHDSKFKNRYC